MNPQKLLVFGPILINKNIQNLRSIVTTCDLLQVSRPYKIKNYSSYICQEKIDIYGVAFFLQSTRTFSTSTEMHGTENFLPPNSSTALEDKVALVTGGSRNIGLMCIKELLKNGAKAVMIADIDETEGKNVIQQMSREFGESRLAFIRTDTSNIALLRNAFNWTRRHFKDLSMVVNVTADKPYGSWLPQLTENVQGIVRGTLLGFEYMGTHNNGNGGVVINVINSPTLDEKEQCPISVGTRHLIIGFGRAMSYQFFEHTSVGVVTLCITDGCFSVCDEDKSTSKTDDATCDFASVVLNATPGTVWTTS